MPHAPALIRNAPLRVALIGLWVASAHATAPQPADVGSPIAITQWPRVFFSPEQRAAIEEARRQPQGPQSGPELSAPAAPPVYAVEGLALGGKGATAWINGQMLQQGETLDGRTVHIEAGAVRLRRAGEADIVLRPGQQGTEPGAPIQDVISPGTIQNK